MPASSAPRVCVPALVLIAAAVTFLQATIFFLGWSFALEQAGSLGRFPRGGVAIGITFYWGFRLFIAACVLSGGLVVWLRSPFVRTASTLCVWAGWSAFLAPAIPEYPYRAGTFWAMGSLILLGGSVIALPRLSRWPRRWCAGGKEAGATGDSGGPVTRSLAVSTRTANPPPRRWPG